MRLGLAALFGFSALAFTWEREPLTNFHERRARLVQETGDGVVVLFGYREKDVAASTTPFHQNENFYYLTGWNEPDAILLLVPKPSQGNHGAEIDKEILYIPPHDYRQEKWTGPKLAPNDAEARGQTGFPSVEPIGQFPGELAQVLKSFPRIYTELTPQAESGEDNFELDMIAKLRALAPLASFGDIRPRVTRMRMVKTPGELALIVKAVEASVDAQLAAMKAVRPGVWEYEVGALIKYEYERRGCEWPAYPPIVGPGF